MNVLEQIDFPEDSIKHSNSVKLLNNQLDVECSDNMAEFFMNATVNFLKNSIINDIMQVQVLESQEGIIQYLRCVNADDNKMSIQLLEDDISIESHKSNNSHLLENLQDCSVSDDDYKKLIIESYAEFENKIISEIIEQSNKIEISKNEYSGDKLNLLLLKECNTIAVRSRRGVGNVAVMSTDVFNTIIKYNSQLIQLKDDEYYLANNIKIKIRDSLGDKILLAYNGNTMKNSNVDGGGFFAPYRLFDNIRILLNATTLEPELYYSSKYTTKFYDADKYYTTITLI